MGHPAPARLQPPTQGSPGGRGPGQPPGVACSSLWSHQQVFHKRKPRQRNDSPAPGWQVGTAVQSPPQEPKARLGWCLVLQGHKPHLPSEGTLAPHPRTWVCWRGRVGSVGLPPPRPRAVTLVGGSSPPVLGLLGDGGGSPRVGRPGPRPPHPRLCDPRKLLSHGPLCSYLHSGHGVWRGADRNTARQTPGSVRRTGGTSACGGWREWSCLEAEEWMK